MKLIKVKHHKKTDNFCVLSLLVVLLCFIMAFTTACGSDNKKEVTNTPEVQVKIPNDDLQKLFMELKFENTIKDIETMAKKYNMKIGKRNYNGEVCYKIGKAEKAVSFLQDATGDYIQVSFDSRNNYNFMLAYYHNHTYWTEAILFKYGSYFDLHINDMNKKEMWGYYYYNNDLRSKMNEKESKPPYIKCSSAHEALARIYTYKKK